MNSRPQHGVLVISIDAVFGQTTPVADRVLASTPEFRSIRDSTTWLLELLDEFELPATWFFNESTMGLLASRVTATPTRHEIGLFIGGNAAHKPLERPAFSRDLERRLSLARLSGVEISSLAAPRNGTIAHLDLLAKHGIAAVRQRSVSRSDGNSRSSGWRYVEPLRFGIWNVPATIQAQCASPWRQLTHGWTVSRHLRHAAIEQEYCHLTVDLGSIINARAQWQLRRMLGVAARLFARTLRARTAQVLTMAAVTQRLAERAVGCRAQSILRAA